MQTSVFALVACLFALPAGAAEPASEAGVSVTIDFVVTSMAPVGPVHRGDPTLLRIEFAGISRNEAGGAMFDGFGVRCVVLSELAGDRGECTATDRDGDNLRFAYRSPGDGGEVGSSSMNFTGGTGKFAGLTGCGQGVNAAISSGPGLPLFLTRQRVIWKLPAIQQARRGEPATRF